MIQDTAPDPEDQPWPDQGLYVCLPAEELTLSGFADGGRADTMAPGPLLGEIVHAAVGEDGAGLAALSEDQLMGIVSAAQRMESRATWTLMAAIRELAARRPAPVNTATRIPRTSEFAADELAAELHLTWQSAADQMAYACAVADRLPRTFAALAAGRIHPVHLRIIEDETRYLSAADAARADEILAQAAPGKTFGELRYAAHRLVLKLDPEAAARRKAKAAKNEAHVRPFREDSGNAGMVARELPPDEILASWQHVEQRALDLRAAGVPGTLRELRARAYLDLLQERDSSTDGGTDPSAPDGPGPSGPGGNGPGGPGESPAGSGGPGSGAGRPAGQDRRPSMAALVNITVPLSTLAGLSGTPGEAAGFGLLDAGTSRAVVEAAARHPRTRWCVTALHPDGTAAAHGCLTGRTAGFLRIGNLILNPVIRGPCDHSQAEGRYRPSRRLRHLIQVRNARCTAPGCSRPAARCDLDHTTPWHLGGLTCPCDLAPLCRHHHRCKQAEGWWLEQPEPGVLRWHALSGRRYTVTPTQYPA